MTTKNMLKVSCLNGNDVLLLNGFQIHIKANGHNDLVYEVYRKDILVYTPISLQYAVEWCEE